MKLKNKNLFAIITIAIIYLFSIGKSISQVTDYDGNVYKTVTIGTQEWMAENLNVEHYRNGDVIPQVQDPDEWINLTTGAWCYYENNSDYEKTYGKLYNWYAVNDPRGLAPEGWRIPSDEEWTQLTDFLGGITKDTNEYGDEYWIIKEVGNKLKVTTLWSQSNEGTTNESGFTAFPGGERAEFGLFNCIDNDSWFWSSSQNYESLAWSRFLTGSDVVRNSFYKGNGLSVRCVKD